MSLLGVVGAVVVVLASVVLPASIGGLTASGAVVDVAGMDVDAIAAQSNDDHVVVVTGAPVDRAVLLAQVQRARSANVPLTVVAVPQELTADAGDQFANELMRRVGGTVLLLSPNGRYAQSDSVGESLLAAALTAAVAAPGDAAAATAFVDEVTARSFPWALIGIIAGGVLVLLLSLLGLGIRRRRQHAVQNKS